MATHRWAIICSGPIYAHPWDWINRTFLESYDPDYNKGEGRAWFTPDVTKAALFDSIEKAMAYVNRVPVNHPMTESGVPNYPIRCFNVEYQTVPIERYGTAQTWERPKWTLKGYLDASNNRR
jgi:hypothetical protein